MLLSCPAAEKPASPGQDRQNWSTMCWTVRLCTSAFRPAMLVTAAKWSSALLGQHLTSTGASCRDPDQGTAGDGEAMQPSRSAQASRGTEVSGDSAPSGAETEAVPKGSVASWPRSAATAEDRPSLFSAFPTAGRARDAVTHLPCHQAAACALSVSGSEIWRWFCPIEALWRHAWDAYAQDAGKNMLWLTRRLTLQHHEPWACPDAAPYLLLCRMAPPVLSPPPVRDCRGSRQTL